MTVKSKHIIAFVSIVVALSFCSCKAKYLEIEAGYQKAKEKKKELETENKQLVKSNALLADSLSIVVEDYGNLKTYSVQISEIEGLKKEFLRTRVPYYIEIKKRLAEKPKSNHKK
jgi:hypothetical protein